MFHTWFLMAPRQWTFIAVVGLWALCGCAEKEGDGSLHVVSFAPDGVTSDATAPLRIGFDRPIADESRVGKEADGELLKISPALPVHLVFGDRQTLIAKPGKPMAPGTRYTVTLAGQLAQRILKSERARSFVHAPLEVDGVREMDMAMAPPRPVFALHFNHPVSAAHVIEHCHVVHRQDTRSTRLETDDDDLVDRRIPLRTEQKLKQGERYAIFCDDLVAAAGNEPLAQPFEAEFTTYPTMKVVQALPTEDRIPPDGGRLKIVFATPVDRALFDRHVRVVAGNKNVSLSHFERSADGTDFTWNSWLEAETAYRVSISKGLVDVFGQKLTKTVVRTFETTEAPPDIRMETGILAVEKNGDGHHLWSRNVQKMTVSCARIPVSRVAELITSGGLDFYPWWGSDHPRINWKKLKLSASVETRSVDGKKNRWTETRLPLHDICGGGEPGGIFLAEFESDEVRAARKEQGWGPYPFRLLGNVTDMGVVMKVGGGGGLIFTRRISDGSAVSGAKVTLYDDSGAKVFSGATDKDGILLLPGTGALKPKKKRTPEEEYEYGYEWYSAPRFVATVEKDTDVAVVDAEWNSGIASWNFDVDMDRTEETVRVRGFIQSDRGIYRPGETVHFKGLVREFAMAGPPRVPKAKKARVSIEDTTGTTLYNASVNISRFGGFHFSLSLDEGAHLGDYHVKVTVNDQTFNERFIVEEFRPAAFEIQDKTKKKSVTRVGATLNFAFGARYLFGAPVKDAVADWSVQRRRRFVEFADWPGYRFTDDNSFGWGWYYDDEYGYEYGLDYVADGQARTDEYGMVRFSLTDPEKKHAFAQDYIARVSVTDKTDQTISKSVVVTAHPTDFYLGLKTDQWFAKPGVPVTLTAVAVQPDGKALATDAKLLLLKERWDCTGKNRFGGYDSCERKLDRVSATDVTVDKDPTPLTVTARKSGDYVVRLQGTDTSGRKVSASTSLWVTGPDADWVEREVTQKMELVPSKTLYRPGETASLIARTDTRGATLLVTVERDGIIESRTLDGVASGEAIDIPLKDTFAPNVYVSVVAVRPRTGSGDGHRARMWMGLVNLKVSAENKHLRVQVETDRTDYRPGDLVKGRIVVTADGAPVESEVSLSAADEGVLQLINFATPDPMNTFYAPFGLGVDTAASWLRIARPLAPDDLNGEDGADGGGAPGERIRSRFVASAYWAPALITNRNGEVAFQFKAPDNLTAFRLMAVAADGADRFGAGDRRIRIAKKLQALPVLPRFLSAGDTAKVGAVVHNYSGKKGTADVVLKLKGARTATDHQSITVPAGESAVATFPVTAEDAQQAEFTVEVRMNGHFDAFALTLPVRRNLVTDRQLLGDGRLDGPMVIDIDWPAGIRENDSDLQLTIDRFGMGALAAGLQYLIGYPYGCLEQTMSKLVPMFKVKDLAASMKLDALKDTDLDTFISLGVAKVLRHQHDDGHFSLWIGSEPEPFLTAYALWGLLEAQSAGIQVNRRAMENGRRALAAFAGETRDLSNRGDAAELAIAAWVLARLETPDAGLTARLFESRASLPLYGRAFLLRAFLAAGQRGDETTTLVNELVAAAQTTGNTAFIEEEDGLSWYMSSSARTTAIAISALLEYDRAHPLIEPLVEGLKARRSGAGRWENTQENAYALIAIADFVRGQAEGSPEVTVAMGDRVLLRQSVQRGDVISLSQPLSAVGKGRLSITGTGPVFYNATLSLVRDAAFHESVDQGLKVEREYLDGDTLAPIRAVAIGDIVRVRLLVTSRRALDYLALEDPFPAGFEAVNTNLSTEDSSLATGTSMSGEWTYRELRDDRVQAFANRMSEGQQVLEYLLRATTEGTFAAAPAHAEAMYEPSTMGRTDAISIPVSR